MRKRMEGAGKLYDQVFEEPRVRNRIIWMEVFTTEHLDELLPRADFVALSLPNSPATYHIMDERRLRLMKKTAFLLNVGRGSGSIRRH